MKLPICVHTEPGKGYGVSVPDVPGCFTHGDDLDQALVNLQEAIECYYEGEDLPVPEPSDVGKLAAADPDYCSGGFWMLADVDFGFLETKHKRVNITLPVSALNEIDKHAKKNRMSRSAFLVKAAQKVIRENSL